jgi:two-component system chemotaxis response regulator CheB
MLLCGPEQLGQTPASAFDVVALAASAGGLRALSRILGELPADFPAAVLVAQHRSGEYPELLADLLASRTALPVKRAEQEELPRPGWVYVAPAGRNLVVQQGGALCVRRTERVRFVRPSADLLFESVAARGAGGGGGADGDG